MLKLGLFCSSNAEDNIFFGECWVCDGKKFLSHFVERPKVRLARIGQFFFLDNWECKMVQVTPF